MSVPTVKLGDGRTVKLGRKPPRKERFKLDIGKFVDLAAGNPPPPRVDYAEKAKASIRQTLGNTQEGDCVIASAIHQLGLWTANELGEQGIVLSSDSEALHIYRQWCGGGDDGCVIQDVLDLCVSEGLPIGAKRYKLDGYAGLDWTNKQLAQICMYVFGSLKLGINLPSAWTSGGDGSIWGPTHTGSVGGHDVPTLGYDEQGVKIATWGGTRIITWDAFLSKQFLEEAWVELSPQWYESDRISPSGVSAEKLAAALAIVRSGGIPDVAPTPPTPPVPPGPAPIYIVLSGMFPAGVWGRHELVQITGQVGGSEKLAPVPKHVAWLTIFGDLLALAAAVRSNDIQGIALALGRLREDLGL